MSMENSTIEIEVLKIQLKELEKENDYLKTLLRDAGIDYTFADNSKVPETVFVPDQGSRIVPIEITRNHARLFFSYFWGRLDVYSKRSQNKTTGKAGYFPQCDNFWRRGICPKASSIKVKCKDCTVICSEIMFCTILLKYVHMKAEKTVSHIRKWFIFRNTLIHTMQKSENAVNGIIGRIGR